MKGQPTEIWKIYNKSNSTLEIPVYQRNYDWGTQQCARLFDDLEKLSLADPVRHPKHFFGAVVGKSEGSWKWVVIDGQQRLTTISLLMLALTHAAAAEEINPGDDPELTRRLVDDFLLVDADPRNLKFKLKPVKNDAAAYKALFGQSADFIEASNVTANYRYFRRRLGDTRLDAQQIWDAICRLEVMHLDLEPHDDPQRIFESLNSTGLDLSEADKIRNFVLMNQTLAEQERLYEDRWNPIEENVDYRTDWFIRWYLTAKTSKTPRESDVFEAFKRFTERSKESVPQILDDMHDYSRNSRAITHAATGFAAVDRRLRRANLIIGDVVHPFLMPVIADARKGIIDDEDLCSIVQIIESYLFRRITCGVAANAVNKIMATAYAEIRRLHSDGRSYSSLLTYVLRRRDGGSGRFPADSEFQESFAARDSYHLRPSYRRYLFDVLENGDSMDTRDIARGLESGELSVEHVMPQTLTPAWEDELGPEAKAVHDVWKNRIGNLTVTGYNSAYSNSPFSRKKEIEHGFDSSPYRLNTDMKSTDRWNEAAMRVRSQRLAEVAMSYWAFVETDFVPPEVVRPTEPMGEDTSFRGRDVTAYEYGDASETVTDWANLTPKLLADLLQLHRSELLEFAADESMLTTSPAAFDSVRGLRIVDPSLGVWVSNSTDTKIGLFRRIFDHLDLDTEDLIFTLRPDRTPHSNATVEVEKSGPYASLTKFKDAIDEAAALQADESDTVALREEFASEFAPLRREAWTHDIGNLPLPAFIATHPADTLTSEEVLAVITGLFAAEQMFGPGAIHRAIMDGTLQSCLRRLSQTT
ncbi:MAG: DUF262 domain-containing protein [Brevibacterium sp.]